jgi:8-oxo-dGTP pyrophosphatase MutT (NUDIX family)
MTEVVARTAGRLLIIDQSGRALMINEEIEPGRPYWLVPGGGVEGAELPRQAAVREAFEETGLRLTLDDAAPELLLERRVWSYGGTTYDQMNHFFAVRVDAVLELTALKLTDLERATFRGFRWWHPDEIDASAEIFYPDRVAELIRRVVATELA